MNSDTHLLSRILPPTRRRSIIFLGNPHGIPSIEVVNSEVADGAHLRDVNHFEAADEILQDEKTQGVTETGVFWSLVNFGKIFFLMTIKSRSFKRSNKKGKPIWHLACCARASLTKLQIWKSVQDHKLP